MGDRGATAGERLEEIVAEMGELEPRERLEVLLEYCARLQPLPPKYQAEREAGEHRVHECQTPVFLWVDLPGGKVRISADVAPEAPTVKGFVGLLIDAFQGAEPAEIFAIEPSIVGRLGLSEALGMLRMRGLSSIFLYLRKLIERAVAATN